MDRNTRKGCGGQVKIYELDKSTGELTWKEEQKITKEEIEKYQERGKVLKQTIKDSNQEIEAIQATASKAASEEFKTFNSERLAEEKQSATDRLAAARQMEDLRFELMEEGKEKDLTLNNSK